MTQARPTAPPDAACDRAYDEIMAIARAHALVVSAAGGVAALAIPREQRAGGVREHALAAAGMSEVVE